MSLSEHRMFFFCFLTGIVHKIRLFCFRLVGIINLKRSRAEFNLLLTDKNVLVLFRALILSWFLISSTATCKEELFEYLLQDNSFIVWLISQFTVFLLFYEGPTSVHIWIVTSCAHIQFIHFSWYVAVIFTRVVLTFAFYFFFTFIFSPLFTKLSSMHQVRVLYGIGQVIDRFNQLSVQNTFSNHK